MSSKPQSFLRTTTAVLISTVFLYGCSSSDDDDFAVETVVPTEVANGGDVTGDLNDGSADANLVDPSTTDGDGGSDAAETVADPDTVLDTDGDGDSDAAETVAGTDSLNNDTLSPVEVNVQPLANRTLGISWQSAPAAQFYRVLENRDGASGFTAITGDLPASSVNFDHRISLLNSLNASYIVQACTATECVDSPARNINGSLNDSIGYFKASNTGNGDDFGESVVISADGATMAVGAPSESSNSTGVNGEEDNNDSIGSGAVYVFKQVNGNWEQQAYLKASNSNGNDSFGENVSLSADGNTLAVGARLEDSGATGANGNEVSETANNSGAVYVFERSGTDWEQTSYLKASNTDSDDHFGSALTLSANGARLAVGANQEDSTTDDASSNELANSGAVYVFNRTPDGWEQEALLKAPNADANDMFGTSLSLSSSGNALAIGAPQESSSAIGVNGNQFDNFAPGSGAAYVFTRQGRDWGHRSYIKANVNGGQTSDNDSGDLFGDSISLSGDGSTLAVGARQEDSSATGINGDQTLNNFVSPGAVFVFALDNGNWTQEAFVKASNTGDQDRFGRSLSLSEDGQIMAVGASSESSSATGINGDQFDNSSNTAGAVYRFQRGDGIWRQQSYIKSRNTNTGDLFGWSVSLTGDGGTLAVGAFNEDGGATGVNGDDTDLSASGSGAVYLY